MAAIDIMTWNVRYFGHGTRGLRASQGWIDRLAAAVAAASPVPDVIALQEVETRSLRAGLRGDDQLDRFAAALSGLVPGRRYRSLYYPAHRYALAAGPALYTTGLAVLVADHIEVLADNSDQPHAITHVPESRLAGLKQSRVLAHVRLGLGDAQLDVFNTHLSLPAFTEVGPHRVPSRMGFGSNQLAEVDRLQRYIDAHRSGPHAVLLGDLNTAPASPVYQALIDSGWVDAHALFTGRSPEHLGNIGTARFMHLRMHLDHVFATPSIQWNRFQAHRVDGAGLFAGLSDHSPKAGRLVIP